MTQLGDTVGEKRVGAFVACVLIDTVGQARIIRLNRPDSLNSFTVMLHEELLDALRAAAENSTIRSVILTGVGKAFCAGQDLQESSDPNGPIKDLGEHLRKTYNPLVQTIRSLPIPVIAAVNGVAAGAGMSLALSCDIIVAARSARFAPSFSKIGLVPDSGGTWILPRLVGPVRARQLALLSDVIDAEVALQWGIINKLVADNVLLEEALAIANRFSALPPSGLTFIKRALNEALDIGFDEHLDRESALQSQAGRAPDHLEAVRAFIEKRAPVFTPRTKQM